MKFNYGALLPGFIVGTTSTFTLFGAITRMTERKSLTNVFDPNTASHIFLITREHDLLNGVEMAIPTIRQCDLNEYEHGNCGNHAVFVANPFGDTYYENYSLQEEVNFWILKCHTIGIKYDWKELMKFWDMPVYDDPKKLICSDLARNMLKTFKVPYPSVWDTKDSPYDHQKYFTEKKMLVPNWKV